jgi:hypothetical protein
MAVAGIGLGDLIVTTADEIRKAKAESAKRGDPVLALESCELELKVTVSAEAGAGIKVWLVDLSTKGAVERASTITLRFGAEGKFVLGGEGAAGRAPESDEPIVPARRAAVENDGGPA